MKRDERNVVRGYATELYQSVGPEGEMEPPPPYVLNPKTQSSSVITLSWEAPKTRLKIVKYTVRYQRRDGDNLIDPPKFIDRLVQLGYLTFKRLHMCRTLYHPRHLLN